MCVSLVWICLRNGGISCGFRDGSGGESTHHLKANDTSDLRENYDDDGGNII